MMYGETFSLFDYPQSIYLFAYTFSIFILQTFTCTFILWNLSVSESTRILTMSASSSLTATGSLLYIQNQGYPNNKISASDTSGSCSVEVQDCSSQIKVYLVHFQLGDGGGSCTGTQQLQIDDDGTVQTLTCSDNTNFEITLKWTSSINYLTVTLGNSGRVNDGYFWLGFEGKMSVPKEACILISRSRCA